MIVTLPFCGPTLVGENVTITVHVLFFAKVAVGEHDGEAWKFPVAVMPDKVREAMPRFAMVKERGALVVPTEVGGNANLRVEA